MKIIKKQDDFMNGMKILRASLGGHEDIGYYITYRGDIKDIQKLLETALEEIKQLKKEPKISPDDGKRYA